MDKFRRPMTAVAALLAATLASGARAGPAQTADAAAVSQDAADAADAQEIALTQHAIEVSTVDPDAVQPTNSRTGKINNHLTMVPTDPDERVGRLYLFIGGTTSSELITQEVLKVGAHRGYHTIAIAYPNEQAVGTLCLKSTDDACSAKVRGEILTGVDLTPLVTVGPADALEPRLLKLLDYLATTYPKEGWDAFITADGQVDWSKVSAVGHSQGAGHVAFLAKRHAMFRATMISGVADITSKGQAAPWLYRPNRTPASSQYGFGNVADVVVSMFVAVRSWHALGLNAYGPLTDTDDAAPGYGGSHMLSTAKRSSSASADGVNAHVAMIEDSVLPRAPDGSPAYKPVWEYMAFPR